MPQGTIYDAVVIGDIYQDHVFSGFATWPAPGMEIFTDQYQWELGGGAVITACALAQLGRRVQLIGMAAATDIPRIADRLTTFGVAVDGIIASTVRTGVTVSISTLQDRTFFTYRGANAQLEAWLLQHPDVLRQAAQARMVHLALPLTAEFAGAGISTLREGAAVLSLDVGHHAAWLQGDTSGETLRAVDWNLPNETEATLMSGSPDAYLEECRALGLKQAVVKLGREGAALLQNDVRYGAGSPTVTVVDTTGAGDVFNAGFLDALLDCAPPQQALERACVCGSLSTRAAGALGALPQRQELLEVWQESYRR